MYVRRRIDPDTLYRLVQKYPHWNYQEYADSLTEAMRKTGDEDSPPYTASAIATMISRKRKEWDIPDRRHQATGSKPRYRNLVPWQRIPTKYQMHQYLRYLRTLDKHYSDKPPPTNPHAQRLLRTALRFEQKLHDTLQVVDLDKNGCPYLRDAKPAELTKDGQLKSIVADVTPADKVRHATDKVHEVNPDDFRRAIKTRSRKRAS
jgi:hypothetical protein